MNPDLELESIISNAQKSYKEKLEILNQSIKTSANDFQNDPLLITLKQDAATEAFIPLRLKELYEDRTTRELIEGLKKELSRSLTEYHIEQNSRIKAEKMLEIEKNLRKEAQEEAGILKVSIKELENNLENLRVKYESGMKGKQLEINENKGEMQKSRAILDDLERNNNFKEEEIQGLKFELDREKVEKSKYIELIEALRNDNEMLASKLGSLENENYNLSIRFKDSSKEIEYLSEKISKVNSEKYQLEESTSLFKLTIESEKEKELVDCKTQLKDMRKKLVKKLDAANQEILMKSNEIEEQKHRVFELETLLNQTQIRSSEDRHDLLNALELNKREFEETLNNYMSRTEFELKTKVNKYEAELDDLKNYYKSLLKSQAEEFEVRAMGFLQRDKEREDQYVSLLKNHNENFIDKKTHQMILTEQLEQMKHKYQKLMKSSESELRNDWEKELRDLQLEKNNRIDELKSKLAEMEELNDIEQKKSAYSEKVIELERIKYEELTLKYEDLNNELTELQDMKNMFIKQISEVNQVADELKIQINGIQQAKSDLEDTNSGLEAKIKELEQVNQESLSKAGKAFQELQAENSKYCDKIEEMANEHQLLLNELNKKMDNYKSLEKRMADFKASAKESADKSFLEYQYEREKNRNILQKSLEESELLKLELEMINKRYNKASQEISYLADQVDHLKSDLLNERIKEENNKKSISDQREIINIYEQKNEELRSDLLRFKKDMSSIFREVFNKMQIEAHEIKTFFIEEIKVLNKEFISKVTDLSYLITRLFNSAKVSWLNELDELNSSQKMLKFEISKYQEIMADKEENHLKDQQHFKNILYEIQEELREKEELLNESKEHIAMVKKNHSELKDLLEIKEKDLVLMKNQFDQSINEQESIYKDSKESVEFYRNALENLAISISYFEEDYTKGFDILHSEILKLKENFKEEVTEMQRKHQEIMQFKDCLIDTKEKNAEYYKDLCACMEKDVKKNESQYQGRISELESKVKDLNNKFLGNEREAKLKRMQQTEEILKRKFE